MLVARNLAYLSQVHSTLNYSRKLAALGRLMAGVAHEVKNPLNAMTIHLELLKQKLSRQLVAAGSAPEDGPAGSAGRSPAVTKHVDVIAKEIRRLDEVVEGFLKFARPEELKLQPVQPGGAHLRRRDRSSRPRPSAAASRCRSIVRTDLPPINADPGMLRQALLNLALNACQAMPAAARSDRLPRRRAGIASRSMSRIPASGFLRNTSAGSSTCISRPRKKAAASACRWSTASSSCTTAKSKCSPRRGAERGSG